MRERVVARARTTAWVLATVPLGGLLTWRGSAAAQPLARSHWAIAVALTGIASAAAGTTAYELRQGWSRTHAAVAQAASPAPVRTSAPTPPPPPTPAPLVEAAETKQPSVPDVHRTSRTTDKHHDLREEFLLLSRAQAAAEQEDFAAALRAIGEHTRRFPDGKLVEEREALRIKALSGLDRIDEARHAARAFRLRFPRSILLRAVDRVQPRDQ